MKTNQHYRLGFAVIVLGLLLFLGLGWMRGSAEGSQQAPTPQAGEADPQIARLREALVNENLSEDAQRSVQEKLEMEERMAAEQAQAAQFHTTKVPLPESMFAQMPAITPAPVTDEIFEGSEGMVRPSQAEILNGWQGQRGDTLYAVLAGAAADNGDQGLLYVFESGLNEFKNAVDVYYAPVGSGPLRIAAVEGDVLELITGAGTSLTFDLTTRTFQ